MRKETKLMNLEMIILIKRLINQSKIQVDVVAGELIINRTGKHSCDLSSDDNGYLAFMIKIDGKRRKIYVHEVIAVIGGLNVTNKTVYHINGNKFDNRLCNLTTEKPQELPAIESKHLEIRRSIGGRSCLTEERVRNIKMGLQLGESVTKLAILHGVSTMTIYNIKNGKTWRHVEISAIACDAKGSKPPKWHVEWIGGMVR